MSDTADRYATREEIENIYKSCWGWFLGLSVTAKDLEELPYKLALSEGIEKGFAEHRPPTDRDAILQPYRDRRARGDFFPFPEELTADQRAWLLDFLTLRAEGIEGLCEMAFDAERTLDRNLQFSEAARDEFLFNGQPYRWALHVFHPIRTRLLWWIGDAVRYLKTDSPEARRAITDAPIGVSSEAIHAMLDRLRVEQSVLVRDWATLAPLVPSLGVVTRSPGAIEAPPSPPAIAAAADAPLAEPAADEETKAALQGWGQWSRYMAKQDIENELNSGCWRTLSRNAGKNGISYDIEMHPENSKQARFRRRLSPPS